MFITFELRACPEL